MKTKKLMLGGALALLAGTLALFWPARTHHPEAPLLASDLKLDSTRFPDLDHLETKYEMVDQDPYNPNAPGMVLQLRELGISSSSAYEGWLKGPHPTDVEIRINVLVDARRASQLLANRYSPQAHAMASRLSLGDESFNLKDRLVAIRVDRVHIELSVEHDGAGGTLMALAKAYTDLVTAKLGKH